METPQQEKGDQEKRVAYPYYGLKKSLEFAGAVRELGGVNGAVRRSLVAHRLALGDTSSSMAQILGAAKSFGLITGRSEYSLTDLGKEYFLPTDEHQRRRALVKMLKRPTVFEKLIDRFDGGALPANTILANIVHREYGVPESWKERVASLFSSSLKEAGIIDASGFVRYDAAMSGMNQNGKELPGSGTPAAPGIKPEDATPPPAPLATSVLPKLPPESSPAVLDATVWVFRGKSGIVKVETPGEMGPELWKKLSDYVNILKPEGID